MKIAVAGVGYVGLSVAVLLAQHNEVTALTTTPHKVEMISKRRSPIGDAEIEAFFREKELKLTATVDREGFYRDADYVVVATPTDYDPVKNYFNTATVEEVITECLEYNPGAVIVIKSTVPVGYTESMKEQYNTDMIIRRWQQPCRWQMMLSCMTGGWPWLLLLQVKSSTHQNQQYYIGNMEKT